MVLINARVHRVVEIAVDKALERGRTIKMDRYDIHKTQVSRTVTGGKAVFEAAMEQGK